MVLYIDTEAGDVAEAAARCRQWFAYRGPAAGAEEDIQAADVVRRVAPGLANGTQAVVLRRRPWRI